MKRLGQLPGARVRARVGGSRRGSGPLKRAELLAALDSVRAWAKGLPESVEPFRLQPIPGLVVQVREKAGVKS